MIYESRNTGEEYQINWSRGTKRRIGPDVWSECSCCLQTGLQILDRKQNPNVQVIHNWDYVSSLDLVIVSTFFLLANIYEFTPFLSPDHSSSYVVHIWKFNSATDPLTLATIPDTSECKILTCFVKNQCCWWLCPMHRWFSDAFFQLVKLTWNCFA